MGARFWLGQLLVSKVCWRISGPLHQSLVNLVEKLSSNPVRWILFEV